MSLIAKQALLLNAYEYASLIKMHFAEFFVDPQPGVYSKATDTLLLPLDANGRPLRPAFYSETQKVEILGPGITQDDAQWMKTNGVAELAGNTVYVPIPVEQITDLKSITSPIVDKDHADLISWDDIAKGLDFRPNQMNLLLELVEAYVHENMEPMLRYVKRREYRFTKMFNRVIGQQHNRAAVRNEMEDVLQPLLERITEFMNGQTYEMHMVVRVGMDIVVEKSTDFRIYDWERRMKSGEWKE